MEQVKKYLKYHKNEIGFIFGMLVCLLGIWWLYKISMESILYAMFFILIGALGIGMTGFFREHNRVEELKKAQDDAKYTLRELPEPASMAEEEYQKLAYTLQEHCVAMEAVGRRKLEDANQYYSMWSHQIKVPIAGMHLLLQEEEPDIRSLEQELCRIEQYVETTLWYQRLQDEKTDYLIKCYPLDDIVKQALRQYGILFRKKDVSLQLHLQPVEVLTDEKTMVFIVEQLLSNAVKYTKHGMVSISIQVLQTKVLLLVEDTGIGIRKEDLPRIFEWGYTGFNGRIDKKSTGIGLALTKQAAEKLGHSIYIESEWNKGTKVMIEIENKRC